MAEEDGYRVPEVCRVVGITYRQLDYWARTDLVNPSVREAGGSGTQRLYSFRDLLVLKLIKQLLDTGVSLQQIRKAVDYLREGGSESDLTGITLMSDGHRIYACTTPGEVFDLLQRGQGVFGIAMDRVRDEVAGSLQRIGATKPKPTARQLTLTGAEAGTGGT
jgi:DNA-binding transcriptional MerR regulator